MLHECPICKAAGAERGFAYAQQTGLDKHWCEQHTGPNAISVLERPLLLRWLISSRRWLCSDPKCKHATSQRIYRCSRCKKHRPETTVEDAQRELDEAEEAAAAATAAAAADGGFALPFIEPALPMPSLRELQQAGLRTLAHVPHKARNQFNMVLASTLQRALNGHTEEAFNLILLLFVCVLRPPPQRSRGGKRRRRQLDPGKLCLQRLVRWQAGEQRSLWDEARTAAPQASADDHRPRGTQQDANLRRATWLASEGRFADGLVAMSSEGFVSYTPEMEETLRKLFPQDAAEMPQHAAMPEPFEFTVDEVSKAIKSFKSGSAGGILGMQPQHLKELVSGTNLPHAEQDTLRQLTRLVNRLAAGNVPPAWMEMLASAPLYALAKKGGGVRPIAVGETLRRIVAKCVCAALQQAAATRLSPTQVGVGERGGCEAAIHAAAAAVAKHAGDDDYVMLKVDFSNAFNKVSRHFLEVIYDDPLLSGAYAWVWACYGKPSHMWWHDKVIDCRTGVQQGDPLGPLLFSLVLQILTDRIREAVPALALNVWYLDDGTLIGTSADVLQAFQIIATEGPALGLHVNHSKCELWWPRPNEHMQDFPAEIKRITTSGVALLGSAVGSGEFAAADLSQRVSKVLTQMQDLQALQNSQIQLCLLRLCLGVPQLVWAMRTMDPQTITGPLSLADEGITTALQDVIGDTLPADARKQAALPVSSGGLGVRQAKHTSDAAYLSSYFAARPLICRMLRCTEEELPVATAAAAALTVVNSRAGAEAEPWSLHSLSEQRPSQETLLAAADKASFAALLQHGSLWDKARLLGVSMPNAGAWLTVVPTWRLKLAQLEHIIACKLLLGMQCYPPDYRICPECKSPSNPLGLHSLSCDTSNDRTCRHDSQCDIGASAGKAAGKSTVREHRHLLPNTQERPGDVSIANWRHDQTAALDYTVVSPFTASVLTRAAVERGYTAKQAEQTKDHKYLHRCKQQGLLFIPCAVETCGGWGKQARKAFYRLSYMMAGQSGRTVQEEMRWLYQRHSVTLQRSNARMVLRRAPEYIPP